MLRRWTFRDPEDLSWEDFCCLYNYSPVNAAATLLAAQRTEVFSLDRHIAGLDSEQSLLDSIASSDRQPSADGLDLELAVARLEAVMPAEVELVLASLSATPKDLAEVAGTDHITMRSRIRRARKRLAAIAGAETLALLEAV
jgi:hypothetical protein